jgi:hypothetical protein
MFPASLQGSPPASDREPESIEGCRVDLRSVSCGRMVSGSLHLD